MSIKEKINTIEQNSLQLKAFLIANSLYLYKKIAYSVNQEEKKEAILIGVYVLKHSDDIALVLQDTKEPRINIYVSKDITIC